MLGVVSAGCGLGAFGLLVHWGTHRRDALGREKDLPVWSVGALTLIAVLAMIPGAQRRVEEHRLEAAAQHLTGTPVTVHCQDGAAAFVDAGAELGYVKFDSDGVPERSTLIKRDQCHFLDEYMSGDRSRPTEDEIVAVHVLTHESMHMRGERVEAIAECEAVQRDAITAQALGATPEQAMLLARRYWIAVYPRMPDGYVTPDCRPGGPLDEHLPTAPWG